MQKILVAEDDSTQRLILMKLLENRLGYASIEATNGAEAVYRIKKDEDKRIVAAILDLEMPEMDGREALMRIHELRPDLPVIILTASSDLNDVVEMMKRGAADFLLKPVQPDRLEISLLQALRLRDLQEEINILRIAVTPTRGFKQIVGHDGGLATAVKLASRAASSDITVLLTGESGSGKERFARAIHEESARSARPFIAVNCGAIPKDLIESTLFGHRKGAFTGAVADAMGKFREADGGTLFLDEVGELPLEAQVKLLRALQQREVEPVGESKPVPVNVRVIAATNRHPLDEVRKGHFREDLYYRLNVYPIHLPPLRERRQDIMPLCYFFMEHYAALEGKQIHVISEDAMIWMTSHGWYGNVRELENTMYRAVLLCDTDKLLLEHVLAGVPVSAASPMPSKVGEVLHSPAQESLSLGDTLGAIKLFDASGRFKTLEEIRQEVIAASLAYHQGNVVQAAKALDVGKSTLYRTLSA
jgi:DNA-binding NtrC family response regulator